MCDTLYAGPSVVPGARAWFAKNSDRHPAEAQALCLIPRRPSAPETQVGRRSFPVPDKGLAFALSKPSWMAGGEAGLNEAGVAIGNEAVFSRWKPARSGALGMDILRAALASSESAQEALGFISAYIEREGQGGNGAYRGSLFYDNSFLISDPKGAYLLETAGKRWAWRAVERLANISNAYTIEEDYKRLDALTRKEIAPVNERAACSDEADPGRKGQKESWRALVENPFYLRFSRAEERRAAVRAALETAAGIGLGLPAILGILRSHGTEEPGRGGMGSPCIHDAGFPVKSATTASVAIEYRPDQAAEAILWFTGGSYPCLSLYKPVLLAQGEFIPLWDDYDYREDSQVAHRAWEGMRKASRAGGGTRRLAEDSFTATRDQGQSLIAAAAERAASAPKDADLLAASRAEIGAAVKDWLAYLSKG